MASRRFMFPFCFSGAAVVVVAVSETAVSVVEVAVVEHVFTVDAEAAVEQFRAELWSSAFDARRLSL